MNRHLSLMGAVMRKDLLVLWPLAAVLVAVLLIQSDLIDDLLPTFAREWANGVGAVAAMLFILGVIHQDASASVRHDWLTKPIPSVTLLAAKVLFIATAIYVPAIAFDFVHQLISGHTLTEAVLQATSIRLDGFAAMLAMILFAAVTATLLEAGAALIAVFAIVVFAQVIAELVAGVDESQFLIGADWLMLWPIRYFPLLLFVPLLWIQYRQRKTVLARTILGVGCFLGMSPVIVGPVAISRIQAATVTHVQAPDKATVALDPDCFSHIVLDADSMGTPMIRTVVGRTQLSPSLWAYEERAEAGPGAIAFATTVMARDYPDGWKPMIGLARASYVSGDGKVMHRLVRAISPVTWYTGMNAIAGATHFWLMPRAEFERARQQSAELVLEYFMSLLEPMAFGELSIDAPRQYVERLGYCEAKSDRAINTVKVNCFKRGVQPAMVYAELPGIESPAVSSGIPDYTPSIFELLSGKSYDIRLRYAAGSKPTSVKITAYEDRTHFTRRVVAPGLLGGPESACPAPSSGK